MKRMLAVLCKVACILFAVVFLIVVVVDRRVTYAMSDKNVCLLPNIAIVALTLVAFAGGMALYKRRSAPTTAKHAKPDQSGWIERHYNVLTIAIPILVFVFHVGVYVSVHIVTSWDVGILRSVATSDAADWFESRAYYYSRYPNNLFLLWCMRRIYSVSSALVPSLSGAAVFAFVSCVATALSCFFFMRAADKIMTSKRWAFVASALFVLLVGASPWALIPYSDSFGLFFCTTLLWCFACGRTPFTKWILPSFLAVVGIAVKPTVAFAFVAWLVARLTTIGSKPLGAKPKHVGIAAACVVGGLALGLLCVQSTTATLKAQLNPDAQFSMTHYMMMGLNTRTDGCYAQEDVDYSASQPNLATREQANWEMTKERLNSLGPVGLAGHLLRKSLMVFNDGTFAWGQEGHFFDNAVIANLPTSNLVASYYLGGGSRYALFCTVQQTLWLITLAGIPLGFLGIGALVDEKSTQRLVLIATMLASLVALAVFLLVFEARARYLYLYGGFFVMLAAWGYQQLWHKVGART